MQFSLRVMPAAKAKSGLPSFRIISKRKQKTALDSFSKLAPNADFSIILDLLLVILTLFNQIMRCARLCASGYG